MPLESTTPKPTLVPAPRISNPSASPALHSRERHHPRRSSTRQSFSSNVRRNSSLSSQPSDICRTLVAQDHDSFSYDTDHLREWYMSSGLWTQLPQSLRDSITTLQHAGAAVSTSFQRLQDLKSQMITEIEEGKDEDEEDLLSSSKMSALSLAEPAYPYHDDSGLGPSPAESFANIKKKFGSITILDRTCSDSVIRSVPALSIGSSPSPPVSAVSDTSLPPTPVSPITKAGYAFGGGANLPSPSPLPTKTGSDECNSPALSTERSFQLPAKPMTAYFRAELFHLKSETLVRLRHASRKVDVEIFETEGALDKAFREWWVATKEKVDSCERRVVEMTAHL
ncbi:hypothetical protein EJ05DRAFT_482087 [Pseudovirgaria hyperparasitica]|uniref:Uncharacterized protein n=1 Tax=Pseudovirgaria hyperparasitica TaxID=470096 RepID=A0A6A6WM88_9PEZI|nr:uncharacterized protein EJ05DRAFT_482087 [Pseudovirgaria hyperparasitica]KAF2763268.1 hypothetical protein EJ05DRAFT_482087 [Pseudovirgaria hyperparasitica]